jgi:hypothetical protein
LKKKQKLARLSPGSPRQWRKSLLVLFSRKERFSFYHFNSQIIAVGACPAARAAPAASPLISAA